MLVGSVQLILAQLESNIHDKCWLLLLCLGQAGKHKNSNTKRWQYYDLSLKGS